MLTRLRRSKAVADGAIWHYFERFVSYRIAKATYGTSVSVEFDPSNPEHRAQQGSMHLGPAGLMLDNGFSAILKKVNSSRVACSVC